MDFLPEHPAAMVPPMSAAAMLSRNEDSTNTMTSRRKPPFQSSGRKCGRTSGTLLRSKWLESSAKPSSRPSRFVRITHSCGHVQREAAEARAGLEAGEGELVEHDGRKAGERDRQDMAVEERHAEKRQREQHELEGYAEDAQAFSATSTSSSIFFASPNSMRLFSL